MNLVYDPLGRMVEQQRNNDPTCATPSDCTEILYGPDGSKLALMNGQSLVKAFIPLPGGGEAVYGPAGLMYYRHADWLGSSRLASTPNRALYYDGAYAAFGESYAETGTDDRSFTGQTQDTAQGLYDFLFREYSGSQQGRWISPDPAGLAAVTLTNPQTWNRYAYVGNNPLRSVDPLGLEDCDGCDDNPNSVFGQASGGLWGWVSGGIAPNPGSTPRFTVDGVGMSAGIVQSLINTGAVLPGDSTPLFFLTPGGGSCELHGWRGEDTWTECTGNIFQSNTNVTIQTIQRQNVHTNLPVPNPIEQANNNFVDCVREGSLAAVGTGLIATLFDSSDKKDSPSTTQTLANVADAALDLQKECLEENPGADLSPNYRGLFEAGDPGVNPIFIFLGFRY